MEMGLDGVFFFINFLCLFVDMICFSALWDMGSFLLKRVRTATGKNGNGFWEFELELDEMAIFEVFRCA